METEFSKLKALVRSRMNSETSTIDLLRWFEKAENDDQREKVASLVSSCGKALYGDGFKVRFDRASMCKDIRRKIYITRNVA